MLETEVFDHLTVCKQMTLNELIELHNNTWNNLTVGYQMSNVE